MFALMSRQKSKYYRSLLPLILVAALLGNSLAQVQTQVSYNRNSPDFNKRSVIEVDPSTLGLNINLPLQDYPGRGLNLPIALYYSSKIVRTQMTKTRLLAGPGGRNDVTDFNLVISDDNPVDEQFD